MSESSGADESLAQRLVRARAACLNDMEVYFLDDPCTLRAPLNPRNEAASLSILLEDQAKKSTEGEGISEEVMECLHNYEQMIDSSTAICGVKSFGKDSAEGELRKWCLDKGASMSLCPATFTSSSGGLVRGLMAENDLEPGECVISIKEDMLISTQTATTSDLGMALDAMGVKDDGQKAVIWTMVDRVDKDSEHTPFWGALPNNIESGLSYDDEDLEMLKGTPAFDELKCAKEHIRESYAAIVDLLNALVATYPEDLTSEQFSWESYLWATQLWYAYAMEVEFLDGEIRSCLVPYATLMNHSIYPHVVQYGKIDLATKSLRLRNFRRCKRAEECFLSYGPLPNIKLLVYYGFAIRSNPYDVLEIDLPDVDIRDRRHKMQEEIIQELGIGKSHFVRAGPIPQKLLCFAMVSVAEITELQIIRKTGQVSIQKSLEKRALEMLLTVLKNQKCPAPLRKTDGKSRREFIEVYREGCQHILDCSLKDVLHRIDGCK
ncbi:hypothetical protein BSKO_10425 [Bryopsis sp. KO-2023]|nr:hypothetical protein BSKO_10425 [Bryopsis sp. KO-2023]